MFVSLYALYNYDAVNKKKEMEPRVEERTVKKKDSEGRREEVRERWLTSSRQQTIMI